MQVLTSRSSVSRLALAASVAAFAWGTPTVAHAAGCQGAPGTSALEQYCEAIPDAEGGRQSPGSGSKSTGRSSSSSAGVSSSTAAKLSGAGADGAAVEQLAGGVKKSDGKKSKSSKKADDSSSDSAAAGAGSNGGDGDGGGTGGLAVSAPADPSNSPLKATTKAVGSGPTVGSGLVWGLLAMSALGAIGAVVLRRHNAVPPGPTDESPAP